GAPAQGLIEFLWGGAPESGGGKRQVVSFDAKYSAGLIIVSFGDRRLYHITKAGQAMSYPIAIPREQSRWQGTTTVSQKRENPDWRPTPDMLKENPKLPSWVPGGHPMNPLGVRALYLGSSTYRIHGTDAPWTIGQNVSKGCIRMFNEDVLDLYPRVPVGTKVVVTWERFKTNGIETAEVAGSAASAPASSDPIAGSSAKGKTRSANASHKAGFFIYSEEEAQEASAPRPTEGMTSSSERTAPESEGDDEVTTYSLQSDGTYAVEGVSSAPRPQEGMVQRYNRKVGGAVSRAAQTKVE
ncbi:MAG: L,D-transpeptidase, partial [Hyphomicrobium sp.]